MGNIPDERRKGPRLHAKWPITIQAPLGKIHAESRDVSVSGVFVFSETAIPIDSRVQLTFTVPQQDIFHQDVQFLCDGTVVRLEPMASGQFGIAVAWHRVRLAD
jgi:hypothetical protein